jgi:hypothetical protein
MNLFLILAPLQVDQKFEGKGESSDEGIGKFVWRTYGFCSSLAHHIFLRFNFDFEDNSPNR